MNKIKFGFFLIILVLASGCKTPTITKVVSAYPDGKTKTEMVTSPDGKIKYEQISYFKDGKVSIRGKFKDNERHGRWESYFMNGKLRSVNNYQLGKFDGEYLVYDKEGNVTLRGAYKNGLKYGEWYSYDSKGNKMDVKKFDDKGSEIKNN